MATPRSRIKRLPGSQIPGSHGPVSLDRGPTTWSSNWSDDGNDGRIEDAGRMLGWVPGWLPPGCQLLKCTAAARPRLEVAETCHHHHHHCCRLLLPRPLPPPPPNAALFTTPAAPTTTPTIKTKTTPAAPTTTPKIKKKQGRTISLTERKQLVRKSSGTAKSVAAKHNLHRNTISKHRRRKAAGESLADKPKGRKKIWTLAAVLLAILAVPFQAGLDLVARVLRAGICLSTFRPLRTAVEARLETTTVVDFWFAGGEKQVLDYINSAKTRICMGMFFISNPAIVKALIAAADRIDEKIVIFTDLTMLRGKGKASLKELLVHGKFEIYHYTNTMHVKTIWIDRRIMLHGSANWSIQGLRGPNIEFTMVLAGPIVVETEAVLLKFIAQAGMKTETPLLQIAAEALAVDNRAGEAEEKTTVLDDETEEKAAVPADVEMENVSLQQLPFWQLKEKTIFRTTLENLHR